MKIINLLKVLGLMTLVLSVMVGCASTTTDDTTQETPAADTPTPSEPSAEPMMPKPMMPKEPMQPAVSSTSQYTVVPGDNLWDISGKSAIYGDPYHWPLIYKANQDKIKDADLIYPDQVFGIELASAEEVGAAVRHARTRGSWSLGVVEESDRAYLVQ